MSAIDFVRQMSILLTLPVVVLLAVSATAIVVLRDWRLTLLAYGILSALLAILLTQRIPAEWALMQAIVGGLVSVMLFLSARQLQGAPATGLSREARWPQLASPAIFRLLTMVLAAVAFASVRSSIELPMVNTTFRDAIVWLVMAGMMGLALHEEPLHAGLALLTLIGGLLLLIFNLTLSRMIVGLLESWQLLLGLAIAYLTVSRGLAGPDDGAEAASSWWEP